LLIFFFFQLYTISCLYVYPEYSLGQMPAKVFTGMKISKVTENNLQFLLECSKFHVIIRWFLLILL